jgi:hypothetical protein
MIPRIEAVPRIESDPSGDHVLVGVIWRRTSCGDPHSQKLGSREVFARAVESQPRKYGSEEGLVCGVGGASEPSFKYG